MSAKTKPIRKYRKNEKAAQPPKYRIQKGTAQRKELRQKVRYEVRVYIKGKGVDIDEFPCDGARLFTTTFSNPGKVLTLRQMWEQIKGYHYMDFSNHPDFEIEEMRRLNNGEPSQVYPERKYLQSFDLFLTEILHISERYFGTPPLTVDKLPKKNDYWVDEIIDYMVNWIITSKKISRRTK